MSEMKKKYTALLLIIFLMLPFVAFGHSGDTDANGGHNSSTGYHYHHGYPEHQHINGECPYEFDDKKNMPSEVPVIESGMKLTRKPPKKKNF